MADHDNKYDSNGDDREMKSTAAPPSPPQKPKGLLTTHRLYTNSDMYLNDNIIEYRSTIRPAC